MYLGPPRYGYALNCHLVHVAIPGTRPLCMKNQNLFYLYATAKSEIQICSNKHETGLVSCANFTIVMIGNEMGHFTGMCGALWIILNK